MGRLRLVLLCFAAMGYVHAQKVVKKSILDPNTSQILIDATNCYQINIATSLSKEIVVGAAIEGEYQDDLLLKIEDNTPIVEISAGFAPNFINPNDKLSAHKVISIALEIQLPQDMKVYLTGTNSNVTATGSFSFLKIALDDGSCHLNTVSTSSQVMTRSGDIYVQSLGATVKTLTRFGKVFDDGIPNGNDYFDLSTIEGNIYLRKTE